MGGHVPGVPPLDPPMITNLHPTCSPDVYPPYPQNFEIFMGLQIYIPQITPLLPLIAPSDGELEFFLYFRFDYLKSTPNLPLTLNLEHFLGLQIQLP